MGKVGSSKAKDNAKKSDEDRARFDKVEKKKEKDKQYRRDKRQEVAAEKRTTTGNTQNNGSETFSNFRKPNVPEDGTKRSIAPPPGFPGTKKTVAPPPGFNEPQPKKQKSEEFDNLSEHAQKKLRTVFLSNLEYSISDDDVTE